ncbi:hypothetical protein [Lactococcus allomyrinae]|uniref:Uncharacterized protein n=1 Tax=Lactococcus allomyrinae TaxID=2419773 RepID=A0A387BNM6_9LACT|nr:hypothetical protein [Lactococcus allomyrinae]AYG00121.1 hypothetical protein D7I46_02875 [Lactococcus allomyrinae]
MTWIEYYIEAAKKSRDDSELWIRYLNKAIQRDKIDLSKNEIDYLTHCEELSAFQKMVLKEACKPGTLSWEKTVVISEPAMFRQLQEVIQELDEEVVLVK